jgi:hypothetical protein
MYKNGTPQFVVELLKGIAAPFDENPFSYKLVHRYKQYILIRYLKVVFNF